MLQYLVVSPLMECIKSVQKDFVVAHVVVEKFDLKENG